MQNSLYTFELYLFVNTIQLYKSFTDHRVIIFISAY